MVFTFCILVIFERDFNTVFLLEKTCVRLGGWGGVCTSPRTLTTTNQPKAKQNDSYLVLSYLSALVEIRIDATNQGRKEKGRRGGKQKRRNDEEKSFYHGSFHFVASAWHASFILWTVQS